MANVKYLAADGATTITTLPFPVVRSGSHTTPKKVGVESLSDRVLEEIRETLRAVTGNDGINMLKIAQDSVAPTVSAPYGFAGVLGPTADGGVWGATGNYGWKIVATNSLGATIGSVEVVVNVDDTTKRVTLSWTQTPNAAGYLIYRTDTPGTYGASTLRTTIGSGATTSFVDDGSATSAGTVPLVNTTAGWNLGTTLSGSGDGGVWAGTGDQYWVVVAYDADGVIIAQTFEATVNVDDVTKRVTLAWVNIPHAASYSVFRSTTPGVYTTPALRVSGLAPGTTSYIDNGAAVVAGTLVYTPSYGIPPALGSFDEGPELFGDEAINQQWFFWLTWVIPGATPSAGNPRLVNVATEETV